ncbi:MAG: PAS domain-containing protein, partial [Nodosilinea sp.]
MENRSRVNIDEAPPAQLWRALFEAAPDAMLVANDEGVCAEANEAACLLLELPRTAIVGQS